MNQSSRGVQISESIQCPFCGQVFDLVIDTSVAAQRFTTDCEVCCRPWKVVVTYDDDGAADVTLAEAQ